MKRKLFAFLLTLILASFILVARAFAQDSGPQPQATPSDDAVNTIARDMYCPICENTPLDSCDTRACAEWRELIRQKLAEGWDEQRIKDYFAAQYGDQVLAEPPARGFYWLIYLVPPLVLLAGVGALLWILRSRKSVKPPLPGPEILNGYRTRVEEELEKRSRS